MSRSVARAGSVMPISSCAAWYELPKARARDGVGSELFEGLGFD